MGCSSSLPFGHGVSGLSMQKFTAATQSYKDFRSRMGDTITTYRQRPLDLIKKRYVSTSVQSEFILTGWSSIISRNELMKRLPDCSIEDTVEKIEADDELRDDEDMNKVYIAVENAGNQSDVRYLIYAYTIESAFYRTLNKKLSNVSAANNFAEYLAAMLINTGRNDRDGTADWPLCFTSVILSAVTAPGSFLKGFCGRTYRGISMTQHDLSLYKVNSLVVQKTFSSSSKLRSVAEKFAKESNVGKITALFTFILDTPQTVCIDLAGLSAYSNEEEVLILPLSIFIVTKINQAGANDFIEIELKVSTSEGSTESVLPHLISTAVPVNVTRSTIQSVNNRFSLIGAMRTTFGQEQFAITTNASNENDSDDEYQSNDGNQTDSDHQSTDEDHDEN